MARLRSSASQLGLAPPPVDLRLKVLPSKKESSLYLQPLEPCSPLLLHEWIEPWAPLRIEFGSRNVMRADFDPLPAPWSTTFGAVDLEMLTLRTDGAAVMSITAEHAALSAFVRSLSATTLVQHVVDAPRDVPLLTPAQESALRSAVAAGYYRIPRPVNLHKLAAKMGISPAALSERLRRAEGRVIERYVALGAATPWDARTVFSPPHVHDASGHMESGLADEPRKTPTG